MYSCWFYRRRADRASRYGPSIMPLHLKVRQETYQWSEEPFQQFRRRSLRDHESTARTILENCYIGVYADLDAGPRRPRQLLQGRSDRHLVGDLVRAGRRHRNAGAIHVVYVYDADGDGGKNDRVISGSCFSAPGGTFLGPAPDTRVLAIRPDLRRASPIRPRGRPDQ